MFGPFGFHVGHGQRQPEMKPERIPAKANQQFHHQNTHFFLRCFRPHHRGLREVLCDTGGGCIACDRNVRGGAPLAGLAAMSRSAVLFGREKTRYGAAKRRRWADD
jgi:hypothetical protein